MLKRIVTVVVAIVATTACSTDKPTNRGCADTADCEGGQQCTAGVCVSFGEEGEGEAVVGEGEGEAVVGEGEGEGGEGEGEGVDGPLRIVSQQVILGAPRLKGNTLQVQGRVAVVAGVAMTGSTFRIISNR